jgi:protein phosphatase
MTSPTPEPTPAVIFGSHSDVGQRREHNEDSSRCVYSGTGALLIVSDGVGGAKAGEVASRMAVDGIAEILVTRSGSEPLPPDRRPWLAEAAREVDRRIRSAAQQPGLSGMGATLSTLWLDGGQGWWVQAGDSRIYLLRGGELRQLSMDQSPVGRMRASGQLSEEEARRHPYKHMIDQCLGGAGTEAQPDTGTLAIQAGDVFVLCSDGLSDGLWDRDIAQGLAQLAAGKSPDEVARALVAGANAASGNDNITAVVGRVEWVPTPPPPPSLPTVIAPPVSPLRRFLHRIGLGR